MAQLEGDMKLLLRYARNTCTAVFVALSGAYSPLGAQEGFPAWIGLYDPAQIDWLENENRVSELCTDPVTIDACYVEVLGPSIRVLDLRHEPDSTSTRAGELIVVAVPGRGLSAHFRLDGSQQAVQLTPDLFLQDWGYGPYHHQTLAAQQGDWFQLPRGPWPESVWIRKPGEVDAPTSIYVLPGDIIEMGGAGWFVLAAEQDVLVLRPEQPADLCCREGEPPPLEPAETIRRSRGELRDSMGHLVFKPKYLKGC